VLRQSLHKRIIMASNVRFKAVLWDVDNTLYPRSAGLGRAMGDRIVKFIRSKIDVTLLKPAPLGELGGEKEINKSYNHPRDIDPSDDAVERVCLEYYEKYGLSLTGFLMHYPEYVKEQEFLDFVHEPSTRLHDYMSEPHVHHAKTGELLRKLKREHNVPLFVFSNAPKAHVDRVMHHLGLNDPELWDGQLYYDDMRAQSKPNEGAYRMALEMVRSKIANCEPEDIIFFDDSKANLAASKKFGIKNCWVRGGGANGELDADEAEFIDFLIDDVRDDHDRVIRDIFAHK
jgi:pyrimidine 5'-nucleotidase